MNRLNVFVGDSLSGTLGRQGNTHQFKYLPDYVGPPVFLGIPLKEKELSWSEFPPAFDGLLPEGVLLEQLLAKWRLDRADKWGQLIAVGRDLNGFLTVLPEDADEVPFGKVTPGQKMGKRAPIDPDKNALPYATTELVTFHSKRKLQMSISGVQPKVSAVFARADGYFRPVEQNGGYILKPSPQAYPTAPENEALTMELARQAGIAVPRCGWLPSKDGLGVFWIERFDRWGPGNRNRLRCEDMGQIIGAPSSWKYLGSLEKIADVIREQCSNPRLQLVRFFERVLFCWLSGNADMHLKNWSLIENGPLIELSPAYDFLNTHLLLDEDEESALELDGKKVGFNSDLLVDYLGREVCQVNDRMMDRILQRLAGLQWDLTIHASHLSVDDSLQYLRIVQERMNRLGI